MLVIFFLPVYTGSDEHNTSRTFCSRWNRLYMAQREPNKIKDPS
jgi:hypothetical protein